VCKDVLVGHVGQMMLHLLDKDTKSRLAGILCTEEKQSLQCRDKVIVAARGH
jgi:hypothetical protein